MWVSPLEDGMAELRALLSAPDALRVYAAPVEPGPLPTLDQCRADALVELLCGTGGLGAGSGWGAGPAGAGVVDGLGGLGGLGGRGAGLAGAGVSFRPGGARPPPAPAGEAGRQVTARPGSRLEWTSPLGAVHTTDPPDPGDEAFARRASAHPPDEGEPDVREPDPGWPWEDFDDDLHRWLDDPAAGQELVGRADGAELQPAG